jgi:hypothetical protein
MDRIMRARPSASMAVALIALFVSLSGVALATHPGGADTISSGDIINGEVQNNDLGADAVGSGKIADRQVRNADLSIGASSSNTIADGGVRSVDVLDESLTAADLDTGSVGPSELETNAIPADGTGDDGSTKLATDSVDWLELAGGSVRSFTVQNGSLTGDDIDDGSLGTGEFASSIPAVHVTHSANQTVDESDYLNFDTERYDTANMHDNSTNNYRLTAPVDGIYAVTAQVEWEHDLDGERWLFLERNESADFAIDFSPGNGPTTQTLTAQVMLAAGDFVAVPVEEASDTQPFGTDIVADPELSPEFSMTWLAPGP